MDMELLNDFLVEAKDLLEVTDEKLVALEKAPDDAQLLNAVFRGYHTIKGGAGFLELDELVRLCHALETLFDALRTGSLRMNKAIMNASLDASNNIRKAMNMLALNPDSHFVAPPPLVAELLSLASGDSNARHSAPVSEAGGSKAPDPTLARPLSSDEAYWSRLHAVFSTSPHPPKAPNSSGLSSPSSPTALSEVGSPDPASPPDAPPKRSPAAPQVMGEPPKIEKDNQIKVDTNRLDAVLTLASEVGLAKNRVGAAKARIVAKDFSDQAIADLDRAFNDLDRLTGSLQNAVMLTRMQPIGRLFQRYPRIVRDLARSLGKNIDIEISGHDTEIDKGMIEDLADPLVHLIRNSSDHGIESPEIRRLAGKPETGMIQLRAMQEGDRILIEIQDDGKGIDPSVIRAKAKAKGIMDAASVDAMTDKQALEIIMLPGFSTAEAISSVSGRGVGMDVVKTNILKMGGEISIDSTPGSGSLMQIRLPLTLAVLPALILNAAGQHLALPLASVQEILSLNEHKPQTAGGNPVINLRGEIVRVLDLSALLGWGESKTATVAALVDIGKGRRAALRAEGFIGREEVMVKPLEGAKPKGVSGVMVDAQGDIVLILDLKELLASSFGYGKD